jgi:hypothetical protein
MKKKAGSQPKLKVNYKTEESWVNRDKNEQTSTKTVFNG